MWSFDVKLSGAPKCSCSSCRRRLQLQVPACQSGWCGTLRAPAEMLCCAFPSSNTTLLSTVKNTIDIIMRTAGHQEIRCTFSCSPAWSDSYTDNHVENSWTDEFEISMTCILHYAKLHVVPCLYYYHKQLKTSQKKQSLNALYILSFFPRSIPKPWDQTKRGKRYGKPSPSLRRRRRRESVCVTRKKNARKTAKRFPKSLNPLSLCVMPSFSFINYAQQVRTFLQESGDQSTEAKDTGGGESDTAGGRVSRAGGLGGTRAGGAARLGVRV